MSADAQNQILLLPKCEMHFLTDGKRKVDGLKLETFPWALTEGKEHADLTPFLERPIAGLVEGLAAIGGIREAV